MSKPQKHRRTQSNSEVDLKHCLKIDSSDDKRPFIEIVHSAQDQHAKYMPHNKEIIIEKLDDDYELQQQKENCGLNFGNRIPKKRSNFGSYQPNNLFLIPEQNDLISSVEQTQESASKNVKDKLLSNLKKGQSDSNNKSLINQIQQISQYLGLKDITHKTLNSERQPDPHKLSFTNELQKKKQSVPQKVTPDRKRIPSQIGRVSKEKQSSLTKQDTELKNNLSVSFFNNLFHSKKQSISCNKHQESQDSYRKLDTQMKKIEKEISGIKRRQDQLDEVNRNIQAQLMDIITESKKSKELSMLSLKKLEQLESITRRNEESITFIRQNIGSQQKRVDSHQTDSTEMSDYHKRFTDYRYGAKAYM